MIDNESPLEITCHCCGARNLRTDAKCWLCNQPIRVGATSEEPILAEVVDARPQFALSTLLLVVTVVCIIAGLVSAAPGLIVPVVIFVVPALLRSAAALRASEQPPTVGQRVTTFAASLGLVILIWTAGLIALGAACTLIVAGGASMQFNNDVVGVLIVLSVVAIVGAFGLMSWIYYRTWPRKNKS